MVIILFPKHSVSRGYSFRIGERQFWCTFNIGPWLMVGRPIVRCV